MKNNPPLIILAVVGVLGLVVALGLFSAITGGLFTTYDAYTLELVKPSPLLALIPLGVGVIAGAAALVIWGVGRQRA